MLTGRSSVYSVALVFASVLMSLAAHAQVPTSGNIFFGYSNSGGEVIVPPAPERSASSRSTNLNGWEGSLEGKLLPWVGIVADFGAHYGSQNVQVCSFVLPPCGNFKFNAHRYTVMFGPQVEIHIRKFTPFAHFLVGAAHISESGDSISPSDTSLSTAIGGGLDYKLIKGLAWRFQGDELHTRFFGGGQDNFRFSTGIVVRF